MAGLLSLNNSMLSFKHYTPLNYVYQIIIISLILISFTGCAVQVPKMEALRSSAIGISLEIDAPLGFGWLTPHNGEIVYFIRVDHNLDMLRPSFIQSNYAKNGRIYLLNALPGEYMAIAYSYRVPTSSTSGPQSNRYLVYFSKDLVKQTHVSISQGQVAFAGNYTLSTTLIGFKLTGMDYVQRHYRNIMNPNASTGFDPLAGIKDIFNSFGTKCENCVSASYEYRGLILKSNRNEGAKSAFLEKAKEDLSKGGWSPLIK